MAMKGEMGNTRCTIFLKKKLPGWVPELSKQYTAHTALYGHRLKFHLPGLVRIFYKKKSYNIALFHRGLISLLFLSNKFTMFTKKNSEI